MTEGAVYINLAVYESGMAPALIINHTKDTMNFWEKHSVQLRYGIIFTLFVLRFTMVMNELNIHLREV